MKVKIVCGICAYVRIELNGRVFKTDREMANLLGFKITREYTDKLINEVFINCQSYPSPYVYGFIVFKPKERVEVYLAKFKRVFENELILAKLGGE